ncbi:MAG TPA: hypothetical protein VK752_05115 [Bryobacteraceae bacterium]|jgi:hypothetical protein|nr:hypothetical protein [Bryobacteraceae bacterium]
MAKKKAAKKNRTAQALAAMRWSSATQDDKTDAARNRALGRWARWRKTNKKPPKPGDEKFTG